MGVIVCMSVVMLIVVMALIVPVVMIMTVIMPAATRIIAMMVVMMAVPVIMRVIMTMIVRMVMLVTMVMRRRLERGRDALLDPRGLFARRCFVLRRHRHDFRCDSDIVRPPEIVPPQAARAIEDQQRRRTSHLISRHRLRNAVLARRIDADRKWPAILLEEHLERRGRHDRVMLEHCMKPDDGDLRRIEPLRQAFRLRQAMLEAAGAQHLEGHENDDAALQLFERQRLLGIRPADSLQLWRIFRIEHDHSRIC